MPELGTYGSVRGARGNSRPYRDLLVLTLSFVDPDPNRSSDLISVFDYRDRRINADRRD
jgi:hypothetical protein